MARSRDISKVLSSSTALATDAEIAATYQTQAGTGLRKIIPSSVAVGSGTGSASALGTVTFSGCSSVSLNDVFSATYDNYKVLLTISGANVTGTMRFRVSGADNSTANYNLQSLRVTGTTIDGGRNTGQTSFINIGGVATVEMPAEMTITYPFATAKTGISVYASNSDDLSRITGMGGYFDATTSFTGFSLIPSSGTITGTVRVYGYN